MAWRQGSLQGRGRAARTNRLSDGTLVFGFLLLSVLFSCLAIVLVGGVRSAPAQEQATLPAFPSAEGHGADTPGGRGGRVIEVTTLADHGPGSFRKAATTRGARIIVFRVGGLIRLESPVDIQHPYLTIAGQTAPGDGICFAGADVTIKTRDVVVRHLRFRPGDGKGSIPNSGDAVEIWDQGESIHDIVVDHSSLSWALDENLGAGAGPQDAPRDITVQWSIISESLDYSPKNRGRSPGKALLAAEKTRRISIHHNLFAHNNSRNPLLQAETSSELINNVVYNWGNEGTGVDDRFSAFGRWGPMQANIVGNYYKRGRDTFSDRKAILVWGGHTGSEIYLDGNVGPGRPTDRGDEWDAATIFEGSFADYRVNSPAVAPSGIATQSATRAYDRVLAEAGATLPARDAVDRRVVASVKKGTGRLISSPAEVGGYPPYRSGTPPRDGDHDGMPNAWEDRHDLNSNNRSDGPRDADGDGYTNVEEYLNGTTP